MKAARLVAALSIRGSVGKRVESCGKVLGKLWKRGGEVVEKCLEGGGKVVERLWKSGGKVVEKCLEGGGKVVGKWLEKL